METPIFQKAPSLPLSAAYDPNGPAAKGREAIDAATGLGAKKGDVRKAVRKMYELTTLENPPFRLILGLDSIAGVQFQIGRLQTDLDAYSSWSTDLMED